MSTRPPDHDEMNRALGSIMDRYSWKTFSAVLNDPAKLKEWLETNVLTMTDTPLDPEDPVVEERAILSAEAEENALKFWAELNAEEREKIRTAVRELWGKERVATLPMSLR